MMIPLNISVLKKNPSILKGFFIAGKYAGRTLMQ